MRVTLRQVAERAGLSVSTVSQVLGSRPEAFAPETRERVMVAVRELGYRHNRAAQALVTGRSRMVALLSEHLAMAYYGTVMNLAREALHERGYDLVVQPLNTTRGLGWPVDGTLVIESRELPPEFEAGAAHGPLASLGAYVIAEHDHARSDLASGVEAALRHLLAGCRRVALMASPIDHVPGHEVRHQIYRRLMAEAGREEVVIPVGVKSRASARQAVVDGWQAAGRPDGIFCWNDDVAIGAYRGLRDLGVRVPDDVALVGCDGLDDTEHLEVPISTVVEPLAEMTRVAVDFLLARIENGKLPLQTRLFTPQLVVRQSSRR